MKGRKRPTKKQLKDAEDIRRGYAFNHAMKMWQLKHSMRGVPFPTMVHLWRQVNGSINNEEKTSVA